MNDDIFTKRFNYLNIAFILAEWAMRSILEAELPKIRVTANKIQAKMKPMNSPNFFCMYEVRTNKKYFGDVIFRFRTIPYRFDWYL